MSLPQEGFDERMLMLEIGTNGQSGGTASKSICTGAW